jgi:IclR family transcriptional regulator, KDG regulon repressor
MVNTVSRAAVILDYLSNKDDCGLSEISRNLNIPKSSAYAILSTLEHYKFIERDERSGRYHLGIKLIELGNRAQIELDICRIAKPYLNGLNAETGETVHLTVLDQDEVLYVDCVESKKRLRTYSVIGIKAPLYCTSVGKAILAFQSKEYINQIIEEKGLPRVTEFTITNKSKFLKELSKIRTQGYAVDNMEHEDYLHCVGAPIYNSKGEVFAAISISGPFLRITLDKVSELAEIVMTTTKEISRKLGFRI